MCAALFKKLLICFTLMPSALTLSIFEEYDDDEMTYESNSSVTSRLYRSLETSYKAHPYFAMILRPSVTYPGQYVLTCGGVFISRDAVLTAAECFVDIETGRFDYTSMIIRYGSNSAQLTKADTQFFGAGFHLKIDTVDLHWKYVPFAGESKSKEDHIKRAPDYAIAHFNPPGEINYEWILLPQPGEIDRIIKGEYLATLVGAGETVDELDPYKIERGLVMKQADIVLYAGLCNFIHNNLYQLCSEGSVGHYRACKGEFHLVDSINSFSSSFQVTKDLQCM